MPKSVYFLFVKRDRNKDSTQVLYRLPYSDVGNPSPCCLHCIVPVPSSNEIGDGNGRRVRTCFVRPSKEGPGKPETRLTLNSNYEFEIVLRLVDKNENGTHKPSEAPSSDAYR